MHHRDKFRQNWSILQGDTAIFRFYGDYEVGMCDFLSEFAKISIQENSFFKVAGWSIGIGELR